MDCSKITAGIIAADCAKPEISGTAGNVWLINYADIDRVLSILADNVITDLVLTDDAKAYVFESLTNGVLGETSINKGTYISNWQHDLTLRIFAKSEAAKKFVNSLNGARVVAIVETNSLNGTGATLGATKYDVYGWSAGLELNEFTGTTDMADGIVYQPKLGSGTAKEDSIPKSLFKTDLATTRALLDSLAA